MLVNSLSTLKNYVLILCIGTLLLFGCINPTTLDKETQTKAVRISQRLNDSCLQVFRKWNFFIRGDLKAWIRLDNHGDQLYMCKFLKSEDTVKLWLGGELFEKDFPHNINTDSNKYSEIILFKVGSTIKKIVAIDTVGHNDVHITNISLKTIFKTNDPFKFLGGLTTTTDSLGII